MALFVRFFLSPVAIGLLFAVANRWDLRIGVFGGLVGMLMSALTADRCAINWAWPASEEGDKPKETESVGAGENENRAEIFGWRWHC